MDAYFSLPASLGTMSEVDPGPQEPPAKRRRLSLAEKDEIKQMAQEFDALNKTRTQHMDWAMATFGISRTAYFTLMRVTPVGLGKNCRY